MSPDGVWRQVVLVTGPKSRTHDLCLHDLCFPTHDSQAIVISIFEADACGKFTTDRSVGQCCTQRYWDLFHFSGGRTHGGGLLGLGVNADQRHSAHSAAAEGNHVTASPQVGLHCFGQGVGDRQAAQAGTVLAEGADEMRRWRSAAP